MRAFIVLSLFALAPVDAHADLFSASARVHGGYADGRGLGGALDDEAFSAGSAGASYGARVGVEVFFVNLWIGHDQYRTSDGLIGTWTTLPMIGFDTEFDVGTPGKATPGKDGNMVPGDTNWFLHFGFGVGFGLGTGQQIDPPLDNSEITDKGFLVEAEIGLGRRIARGLSLGLAVPVQGRMMFKNGADAVANDPNDRYQSLAYAALLNLRLKLKLL